MQIGYARISTQEQTLDLQHDALAQSGCGRIFDDTASGAKTERPGLVEALSYLRAGDTLVVWRLDRLSRSLWQLIETVVDLSQREIGFRSLTEQIDTTTSTGKLVFHVFGALAEFERDLIRERTQAGLAAARARGRVGGHPRTKALDSPEKVALAQTLYNNKHTSIADICRTLRISPSTLYRYIRVNRGSQTVPDAAYLVDQRRQAHRNPEITEREEVRAA